MNIGVWYPGGRGKKINTYLVKKIEGDSMAACVLHESIVAACDISETCRLLCRGARGGGGGQVRKPGVEGTLQADLGFLYVASRCAVVSSASPVVAH